MEQTIKEVLQRAHQFQLSLKEVLDSYDHITLTDDELVEAILWAKRKKESELNHRAYIEKQIENRKAIDNKLNFDVVRTFMINRAKRIFKHPFDIDTDNEKFFNMLCYYFSDDEKFIDSAKQLGEELPSLKKGLCIVGNFGTGKTVMMRLFQQNTKQTYYIRSAKDIAQAYLKSDDKEIPEEYILPFKNALNDASVFYQPVSGLCIDDMGSENKKNNFGNVMNVVGDLLEAKYSRGFTGALLHATSNLSADELKNFYGERVISRMCEIFNFIELPGGDRRK